MPWARSGRYRAVRHGILAGANPQVPPSAQRRDFVASAEGSEAGGGHSSLVPLADMNFGQESAATGAASFAPTYRRPLSKPGVGGKTLTLSSPPPLPSQPGKPPDISIQARLNCWLKGPALSGWHGLHRGISPYWVAAAHSAGDHPHASAPGARCPHPRGDGYQIKSAGGLSCSRILAFPSRGLRSRD